MGEYTETLAPTCTAVGEERSDCSECDYYVTREIAKTAHTEEAVAGKAPTCTGTGLTDGVICSVCGETVVSQTVIGAKGHKLGEWTVVTAPTCTEEGLETADCSECDYSETRRIAKTDHEYDENNVCIHCGDEDNCIHICHRTSNIFAKIVWGIIRYICSIFGIARECSCGDMHY